MPTITGGAALERKLRELARQMSRPATLRVGFLEHATYPNGTPVAMIAAIQDYGAPNANIPPRPFFRNMVAAKSQEWPNAIALNLRLNNNEVEPTMRIVAEAIAGQLRESIIKTNAPPLSPITIARKGFAKPLIDTSHMINSVDYEVRFG